MEFKDMSKEDLNLLSYTDLTDLILRENKKPMNTPSIFRMICDLFGYTDEEYTAKIGDYYTSLTTDKRFVLLDSAEWDLKDNHIIPIELDDEEEIEDIISEEDEDEDEDSGLDAEEDDIDSVIEDDLDESDDGFDDLSIVADSELEES
ncbi:MAG: DNA-directed RNA polymerase subunit delta [Bacilli bacterium]|nr:DNA-directed RNA polymerase subunit delta [Bacilli bacterium]MDD4607695.1 DNA-directed RNA polymerase subunit delta [Bacilli bacterium]